MQADKAGHAQIPSNSLRTSQPSTTRLGDSDKLTGTPTHTPDSSRESIPVAIQLPADGTRDSMLVRPAAVQAVQMIGSLARLSKELGDSREAPTNKRTQSQAGIGDDGNDDRGAFKRLRTVDTTVPPAPAHGNTHGHPNSQSIPRVAPEPTAPFGPRPASQPVVQTQLVPPVVPLGPALSITPDMRAKIAMFEALRMAKSITSFQPEQISQLFQHLCRSQLWPLLKLEELRVMHQMNTPRFPPAPRGATSGAFPGRGVAVDSFSSTTTTTTTTTTKPPGLPKATPLAGTASTSINPMVWRLPVSNPEATIPRPPESMAKTTRTETGDHTSKIIESLLPDPPNPPSPDYARDLLSSLSEEGQRMMKSSAPEIRALLGVKEFDLETTNNKTAFTCLLVEISSHGGLPNVTSKLDDIVQDMLRHHVSSYRRLENQNGATRGEDTRKHGGVRNPAYAHLLRLLPEFPQFARVLGLAINKLSLTKRAHLGLTRKFNAVLELMCDRRLRSIADVEFKQRLATIIDGSSLPVSSSGSATASTTARTTASAPASVPAYWREGDVDEGSDGEI